MDRQQIDVMGVNFYPHLSVTRLEGGIDGPVRRRRAYGTGADLSAVLAAFATRYGKPVMVTETSDNASVARRARWMDDSIAGVEHARSAGVPVVGYTWFPVFTLADWRWRRGSLPADRYWCHMGLWDLADDGSLQRRETPLVGRFAGVIARRRPGAGHGPPEHARDVTQPDHRRIR